MVFKVHYLIWFSQQVSAGFVIIIIFLQVKKLRFRESMLSIRAWGLPWWLSGKESTCKAGNLGSIPGLGKSPGEKNGNLLQYSCLGNPMDTGAWGFTVHGAAKIWTRLNNNNYNLNPRCWSKLCIPYIALCYLFTGSHSISEANPHSKDSLIRTWEERKMRTGEEWFYPS